jgi:hypothetical protein
VNPSFNTLIAQVYAAIGQGAVQVTTNTVGNNTTFTITLTPTIINLINSNAASITTIEGDITTIQGDILALQNSVTTLQTLVPVLLHSDTAVNSTTNVSGDQVLKTYTLPANTLGVNGDIIEIEILGLKFGDLGINVWLEMGGQPLCVSLQTSSSIVNIVSQVVRTGSNGQVIHSKGTIGAQPNITTSLRPTNSVISRRSGSIDLTNNQTIQLRVEKTSGNFTADEFRAILLTIKHYKK